MNKVKTITIPLAIFAAAFFSGIFLRGVTDSKNVTTGTV